MNQKKRVWIVPVIFFQGLAIGYSADAWAQGSRVTNGGNAVVCRGSAGEITSVELFDYWEGVRLHPEHGTIDLGSPSLSVSEKIDLFLERMRRFDPSRADAYAEAARKILDQLDSYLVAGMNPTPLPDDQSPIDPEPPCTKEQFAVQVSTPTPGMRRFQINRDLYQHAATTNDARAGILLHEIIYREALGLGQTTSDRIRAFHHAVAAGGALRAFHESVAAYSNLLSEVGFRFANDCRVQYLENVGSWVHLRPGRYGSYRASNHTLFTEARAICYPSLIRSETIELALQQGDTIALDAAEKNLILISDRNGANARIQVAGQDYRIDSVGNREIQVEVTAEGQIWFIYGQIRSGVPVPRIRVGAQSYPCEVRVENPAGGRVSVIHFRPDSTVKGCFVDGATIPHPQRKFLFWPSKIRLKNASFLSVHPNGEPHGFTPLREQSFTTRGSRKTFRFAKNRAVSLDSSGFLIQGALSRPLIRTVEGNQIQIDALEVTEDGKHLHRTLHDAQLLIEGKPVLFRGDLSSIFDPGLMSIMHRACREQGFERGSWYEPSRMSVEVTAYQEFYDSSRDTMVGFFDQPVSTFKPEGLKCRRTVRVEL